MPAQKVSVELVGRLADELVGLSVSEKDRKAVAELLQSFFTEMKSMRALAVGEDEPATVYAPEADS